MKKIMALVLAAMMLLGCCSIAAAEDIPAEYPEVIEGLDFGGATVYINDWYSSGERAEEPTEEQQAQYDYWDWLEATYNVKLVEIRLGDWDGMVAELQNIVSNQDNSKLCLVAVASDFAGTPLANNLYMAWTIDLSGEKWNQADIDFMTKDGKVYGVHAGKTEPRSCMYFNKKVLKDAGIDPNEIYDLQASGQWTWDKFDEYMGKVQRDLDSDGVDDVFGLTINEGVMTDQAIFSNGGSYIGKDANGYYYNLESPQTQEALNWCVEMYNKYDQHDPEGAQWDYYKEEFLSGVVGFMVEQEYAAMGDGNFLAPMEGNIGFVMFPKGPSYDNYINVWDNNPVAIPANYDSFKAGQLAFAWNLYTDPVPGFEDYNSRIVDASLNGKFDDRAKNETIPMMVSAEHGTVAYHGLIPDLNLGPDLTWSVVANADISALTEAIRDTWKAYVDAANK